MAKKLISFFINLTHGKLKTKRSIVQVELIALRHCVTFLVTHGTLLPLVVLIFQFLVLVYPLVVLVFPLVVLVCPFVCSLVVLAVLSVGLFVTDR